MSSNHSVYYGIYLECEGKRDIKIDGALACPNGHVGNFYGKTRFCATCGAELVNQKETDTVAFSDVVNEENDKFVIDNYCTLKERNRLGKSFHNLYVESGEDFDFLVPSSLKIFGAFLGDDEGVTRTSVPSTKVMVISEVKKLLDAEIKLLRKVLYKKVTVRFGIISMWN